MSHPTAPPLVATLRRLLSPPGLSASECCEICGALLRHDHAHVVDVRARRLLCACDVCGTMGLRDGRPFPSEPSAEGGRYRAVPNRYLRLPRLSISPAQWDALGVPVDLAFFFFNSGVNRVVACYPGPAGATESLLSLEAWPALAAANPWIRTVEPDVEALLVRRVAEEYTGFIVPIDACYELVGRLRREWRGFGGGDTGQQAVEQFFAAMLQRSAAQTGSRRTCAHPAFEERP